MNETDNAAGHLLNRAKATLMAFTDRQLAVLLRVHPSMICRARKSGNSLHPELLISLHEETGWSIKEMKKSLSVTTN